MVPTSQNSSQVASAGRPRNRSPVNSSIIISCWASAPDIMGFTHGGSTTYNSSGSFYKFERVYGELAGCSAVSEGTWSPRHLSNDPKISIRAGSVMTVNTGGSASSLQINANPNWIGTSPWQAGYAFDRLLIFGSAGLAYFRRQDEREPALTKDTATSTCSGVSNVYTANSNAGFPASPLSAISAALQPSTAPRSVRPVSTSVTVFG